MAAVEARTVFLTDEGSKCNELRTHPFQFDLANTVPPTSQPGLNHSPLYGTPSSKLQEGVINHFGNDGAGPAGILGILQHSSPAKNNNVKVSRMMLNDICEIGVKRDWCEQTTSTSSVQMGPLKSMQHTNPDLGISRSAFIRRLAGQNGYRLPQLNESSR
jgi:hypothetical protein